VVEAAPHAARVLWIVTWALIVGVFMLGATGQL
jgi:hypothetical protein